MDQFREFDRRIQEERLAEGRRKLHEAYSQAMCTVLTSMASHHAMGALLIRDPRMAAESMAESQRMLMLATVAHIATPAQMVELMDKTRPDDHVSR